MTKIQELLESKVSLIPAVVSFPIRGDEVLLIHRVKVSEGLGLNLISGVGGKVGGDIPKFATESAEAALEREVFEEIEIKPTKFRHVGRVRFIWIAKPKWSMDVRIYIVDEWEGSPTETAVAKPVWHKIDNLPVEQMWEDNRYWVHKVLAGERIDAVFLYGENGKLIEHIFN